MSEERKKILNMVSEGKLSVDDAERLLAAIETEAGSSGTADIPEGGANSELPKYLFVAIKPKAEDGDVVNIRVPLGLIKAGVKLASLIPSDVQTKVTDALDEHDVETDFDFSKLNGENSEELMSALSELSIDIETENETVKVFCQ